MEISRQADYAVRAVRELAKAGPGALIQTQTIAANQQIPAKYLPTIIRTLARAGLLRTLRGSQGGVSLARQPHAISLLEVVEAIDGPVLLNRCKIRPGECRPKSSPCLLHHFWESLAVEIRGRLGGVSFDQQD